MPACHAGGQGFEPPSDRHFFSKNALPIHPNAGVAQLAEQLICNQQVAGSSPIASSIFDGRATQNVGRFPSGQREQTVNLPSQTSVVRIHPHPPLYAGMAELADAHGSGPCAGDSMQVQVLFPAPRASIYACPFSLALQPRGINKEPAAFKCGRPFLAA